MPNKFEIWIARNPTFIWTIILLISGVISPYITWPICIILGIITYLIDGYIAEILFQAFKEIQNSEAEKL